MPLNVGLCVSPTKKDSIGVCFCPLDYRSFLKREVPAERLPGKGLFIGEKGEILGRHEGYPFYTIGQRRGWGFISIVPYL